MTALRLLALVPFIFLFKLNAAPVPEQLQPWQDWVSYQQEFRSCPFINSKVAGIKKNHLCAWPGKLTLKLEDKQASFSQYWQVMDKSQLPLPGDRNNWPQSVTVNQKPATVLQQGNRAYLQLPKGKYQIKGKMRWDQLPEVLAVPAEVALLDVSVNGVSRNFIERNSKGEVWLGRSVKAEQVEQDFVKLRVNRLIKDGQPMSMLVAINLEVSGRAREQRLTRFEPGDYQLKSIRSELNTRLDSEGNLWVQLKPGTHQLRLEFKLHGLPEKITLVESGENWPQQELWAFAASERLRSVQLEGLAAIDAKQGFVSAWSNYPHYVAEAGEALKLIERHRGISHSGDSLSLKRKMWLSFDADSYYFEDEISGTKSKDWRINTITGYRLNRLSNHDQERLISFDENQLTGAEVRTPRLKVKAGGEVGVDKMQHSSGWDLVLAKTEVELNIPPGKKILAVTGVDYARGDWLNRWSLIDLFFVMLIVALAYRVFGVTSGIFALLTLLLGYHEPQMPLLLWFNLLVAVSLAKKFAEGKGVSIKSTKAVNFYQWGSLVLLLVMLLPFIAEQIRFSLYPQLEQNQSLASSYSARHYQSFTDQEREKALQMERTVAKKARMSESLAVMSRSKNPQAALPTGKRGKSLTEREQVYQSGAIIQAGRGMPQWRWQSIFYGWSGPVNGNETMRLWMISDNWVKLWRVALVAFSLLWLVALFRQGEQFKSLLGKIISSVRTSANTLLVIGLFAVSALTSQPVQASSLPDDKLLAELQQRLYPLPECRPDCINLSKAHVEVNQLEIKLTLEYHSGTNVAGLLPDSDDWQLSSISLNGKPVKAVWRNKSGSWFNLAAGISQVSLKARLKDKAELVIRFPEQPRLFSYQSEGWSVSGVSQQKLITNSLRLLRSTAQAQLKTDSTEPAKSRDQAGESSANEQSIAGLYNLNRHFEFASRWLVNSRVTRQAPLRGAMTQAIPLLAFEQPLSQSDNLKLNPQTQKQEMLATFTSNDNQFRWFSSIAPAESFRLTATQNPAISESWQLSVSPNWNIQIAGVPALMPQGLDEDDFWIYEYFPRPGESLIFSVTRPLAVEGESLAITSIKQNYQPGKRKIASELEIDYRATRAETFQLNIGEQQLKRLSHDGEQVNLDKVDGVLSIPLKPGQHQLKLELESNQPLAIKSTFITPDIGREFSNLSTRLTLPDNRWLLATAGPGYGPAIIYWGELVFFLLLAIALSRLAFSPLNYWQWLLLGLGMSTFSWPAMVVVSLWLLGSEWRRQNQPSDEVQKGYPPLTSWLIVASSITAVLALVAAVPFGLLQTPDMGVAGNGSYKNSLLWFLDHGDGRLGEIVIYSLPIWVYKALMLIWATWLSFSLVKWLGWIWRDLAGARFMRGKQAAKK